MRTNRGVRKNELKKAILDLVASKDVYGYEVLKKLEINGERIEAPRIYTILKELNTDGLLIDRWERSKTGPRRRIYSLGEKGRDALKANLLEAISVVQRNYWDYLMSLNPKVDIIGNILNQLTAGVNGNETIGYFTNKYYGMTKTLISRLQKTVPEGRVYLIKPRPVEIPQEIDNVDIISGSYENISLKDGYADVLLIIDLPSEEILESAIKEWYRVLSPEGNLGILTPSVLVKEREAPISIGDYVQKHEHEVLGQRNYIEGAVLKKELSKYFNQVEDQVIAYMTIILAKNPKQLD